MRRLAFIALWLSVLAIPFESVLLLPVLGSLTRTFGLAAFACWVLWKLTTGTIRTLEPFHWVLVGFVAWVALSFYWSIDGSRSAEVIVTYVQVLGLAILIWDLCTRRGEVNGILQAYVLGSWITLLILFNNFRLNITEDAFNRFTSTGADHNTMAVLHAIGIPIAWYLAIHGHNRLANGLNAAYIPAACVGVALSGSRAGGIATLIALLFVFATIRRARPLTGAVAVVTVLASVLLILTVVPEATRDRLLSTGSEVSGGDLNGRTGLWDESLGALFERPMFGSGAGTTRTVLPSGKGSHNLALTIGVETGLVGLALLATLVGLAVRSALAQTGSTRLLWFTVLTIWIVSAGTLSLDRTKATWLVLSLIVASGAVTAIGRRRVDDLRLDSTNRPVLASRLPTSGPRAQAHGR